MKKLAILCFAFLLLFTSITPVFAAEQESIILHVETALEDGIVIIDEVIENPQTRSTSKGYTRRKTITQNGETIAIISIFGIFHYDGTTVSVASKEVIQSDTYDGWSYKQNSLTSSGGTITLDAKLTKALTLNIPISMTLSCDKDGNISYT